jgi:hypothetical protein
MQEQLRVEGLGFRDAQLDSHCRSLLLAQQQ